MTDKERDKRVADAHDAFKTNWIAKMDNNLRRRVDEITKKFRDKRNL